METLFSLEGVSVAYGVTPVLHDIRLEIGRGERVILLGPSGAGKTTLLRKLYEIAPATSSLIHQDYALVPRLSVYQNVFIGGLDRFGTCYSLLNLIKPRQGDVAEIRNILGSLDMAEKIFEPVGALSGGQRQRVAVARAMFRGSRVLLADEPVASIDPRQAEKVLKGLHDSGCTVVCSMHHYALALGYFERVLGLRRGRLLFDLPSDQVDEPLLTRLYAP